MTISCRSLNCFVQTCFNPIASQAVSFLQPSAFLYMRKRVKELTGHLHLYKVRCSINRLFGQCVVQKALWSVHDPAANAFCFSSHHLFVHVVDAHMQPTQWQIRICPVLRHLSSISPYIHHHLSRLDHSYLARP